MVNGSFRVPIAYPLKSGQYTIGIRPNEVEVTVNDRNANARVTEVSYLGNETVILADLLESADELRLVLRNQIDVKNADFINVKTVNQFFVFDQNGGLITTAGAKEEVTADAATIA